MAFYRKASDLPDVSDFDPSKKYTPAQLDDFATAFLLEERKDEGGALAQKEDREWLTEHAMDYRRSREVYTTAGIPDPAIAQGIFSRFHQDDWIWRNRENNRARHKRIAQEKANDA